MAVSKLSYKKTLAEATYVLDREICYVSNQSKLVLPSFSSDDEPDLKWTIEIVTHASRIEKKDIMLILERGSRKKDVLASLYMKVTTDVSAVDLANHCAAAEKKRKLDDFGLLVNDVFDTYNEQERFIGTFYLCPDLMEKLTIHAMIEVTDGTLKEIVEYPETPGQIPMGPSRQLENQKALGSSFSTLLDSGEFSDITIRVEGRTIPAHQNVLAARSDVFKAMLTNNFKEQSAKVVEIKDAAFNVVELLLRFMYTGAVDIDDNLLVELLMCADKYMVQDLSALCRDRLAMGLQKGGSAAQLCEMLQVADLLDSKTLRDVAITYLKARKNFIFESREWKQFSISHRSTAAAAWLDASS